MSEHKFYIVLFGAVVIFLAGGYYLANNTSTESQTQASQEAQASVDLMRHDWGNIGINDGVVAHSFTIKNNGTEPLKLFNVKTSCMCTTAQLSYNGKESPEFGMHTKSGYVLEVPSGEKAEIQVEFDPAFHGPQGTGPITRQIFVETNDASKPELEFIVEALVTK